MKSFGLVLVVVLSACRLCAQEKEWVTMQEDQAGVWEGQEADGDLEYLDFWKRRKISLNEVVVDELMLFPFVTAYQAEQLILYRKFLGEFIDILELQAVPGWDELTIRKILPYVSVATKGQLKRELLRSVQNGTTQLMVRSSLKKGSGLLARYQFRSPFFQGGIQLEKDAGEKFWQGQKGISFLSGQVSVNKLGLIRQLVIGDFSISMAQGLVLGLGRAVRKSGVPMMIKRQQPFLLPFRSTDENRFFRGVGIWLAKGSWELGSFFSVNRLDGNLVSDSIYGTYVSSLQTSGLHRTEGELADKNSMAHRSVGFMVSKQMGMMKLGFHRVDHFFSLPIMKSPLLYNKYSTNGNRNSGMGVKAETSFRNMHLFAEVARDREGDIGFIGGAQLAVDRQIDLALLGRHIGKGYKSFWGSSFTEATEPGDEKGVYMGMSFRPVAGVQVDGYIDWYRSEWLKYQVNTSIVGMDQLLFIQFKPNKLTTIYYRYRREVKTEGKTGDQPISVVGERLSVGGRLHVERKLNEHWTWRSRVEWTRQVSALGIASRGALVYSEWFWKSAEYPVTANGRIMFCETDDYFSRIYAYENDVMYYGLIPSFYGKYARVYGNIQVDLTKHLGFQLKVSLNIQKEAMGPSMRMQFVYR